MRPRLISTVMLILALAACGPGGGASSAVVPSVGGAWARAAAAGGESAAYFTLSNPTGTADALISVTSPAAGMAMVHETSVDGTGIAAMHAVHRVELPAGQGVEFKPGSYHVMLMRLTRDLTAGGRVELDLVFEHAGPVVVSAEVRQG